MAHANARLNIHGRRLLVKRVIVDERPVAHVAKELGVSRQCASRWVNRFRAEGEAGLADRSSRPKTCPRRTPAAVEAAVLTRRRTHREGADVIGPELGVPARTVGAILARHQVPLLRQCDPLTGTVIRASKTTAVRYEHDHPGSLVHMDVKKIGRIRDGGGWRAHGRENREEHYDRSTRVGYDYVHSMVDDHSRLAYSEVLPNEKGATCAAFTERALAYFAARGITRVERLMTDNAWAYRFSLRQVCADHQIRQVFIRPHCPWQNGKVERFNRTLQIEWAYRQIFTSNTARTNALAPWLEHYNNRRRHWALGGQPPISRLS